jgi:hypothetical protein
MVARGKLMLNVLFLSACARTEKLYSTSTVNSLSFSSDQLRKISPDRMLKIRLLVTLEAQYILQFAPVSTGFAGK